MIHLFPLYRYGPEYISSPVFIKINILSDSHQEKKLNFNKRINFDELFVVWPLQYFSFWPKPLIFLKHNSRLWMLHKI